MIAANLQANRDKQNEHGHKHMVKKGHQETEDMEFKEGDLIFLRENPAKPKVREMFTVVDIKNDLLIVKKTEGQFRSKFISIRKQEAVKVNTPSNRMDKDDAELYTEEEDNTDAKTAPIKSATHEIPNTRPKRKVTNISQRKTKEIMSML